MPAPYLFRRPTAAPHFHPFFNFSDSPHSRELIKIHSILSKKGSELCKQNCSCKRNKKLWYSTSSGILKQVNSNLRTKSSISLPYERRFKVSGNITLKKKRFLKLVHSIIARAGKTYVVDYLHVFNIFLTILTRNNGWEKKLSFWLDIILFSFFFFLTQGFC